MGKILSRIKQIAENESITIGALERKIGASKGVLSRAIANDTDIQAKWLERIVDNFPLYSPSWLLNGSGSMFAQSTNESTQMAYLIPYYANAGRSVGALDGISLRDMEQVVSPVSGAEYCISIYGDSMQPTYPSGCRVFVKKVQNTIVPGNTYVIDTADGLMLKRLTYSDNPANLLCVSINPDKVLYKPFEYAKKDIMGIYRVMGVFIPVNE